MFEFKCPGSTKTKMCSGPGYECYNKDTKKTMDAVMRPKPCEDTDSKETCEDVLWSGLCDNKAFREVFAVTCKKTCGFCPDGCRPYSAKACAEAAKALKLQMAPKFEGSYKTKGCHAYSGGKNRGLVYYGTGGSLRDAKQELRGQKYRPKNFDCQGK